MKRRAFFGASLGTSVCFNLLSCSNEKVQIPSSTTEKIILAGKTLDQLRNRYLYDLFDDFLPFLDKHVIDHEYGGFMCNTDRAGNNITTNKMISYEGRGTWVYSFLYNNLDKNPNYLEVARKSVEFILKNKPSGKELWTNSYTREGNPLDGPGSSIYGDIFFATGLQEYSIASGKEQYWDMAKEIMLKCIDIYDNRPDYGSISETEDMPRLENPRIIGHWMVLLRLATQMLEKRPDSEVETIANRSVEAVLNHHFNPEFRLLTEYTNHDLTQFRDDKGQIATGHAIETLWMIMFEAARLKDKQLYHKAAEQFKYQVEVFWDDVYGGLLHELMHVNKNIWGRNCQKALWLQEEGLIGLLFMIEHMQDEWAKDRFSKLYTYVLDKYPLKQYGYPLWILYADRKVTFEKEYDRVGNFHHPRHLMINLLALERMIKGGGKKSELFG